MTSLQTILPYGLLRSISTKRAWMYGAAVCYVTLFGLLIYGLSIYAYTEPADATPPRHFVIAMQREATPCAEIAGMGRKLCNSETRFETSREKPTRQLMIRMQDYRASKPRSVQTVKTAPEFMSHSLIATPGQHDQALASLTVSE